MTDPARVAVVGTGVIGTGWAALFLAHGLDVVASDPAPGAADRLADGVRAHWPGLERRGLADGASPHRLTFVTDPAQAVAGAGFVQENGPERLDVKRELFAVLDEAAPPGTVLVSSSSGLLPSAIQEACPRHPERVLVGHPFSPAHLMPLVEVVPGRRTCEAAVEAAMAMYRRLGKRPIRLHTEVPGHVANRLQAALWREAYSLIERGVVSVADLDAAIAWGPGLRWALLGPLANQHLAGGEGGLAHVLAHLGPPMVEWWDEMSRSSDPRLTPGLVQQLVDGVSAELAGTDEATVVRQRDELLGELLRAKASRPALP
jgi:3-hydroxyacyl-CoA dehydrogenase